MLINTTNTLTRTHTYTHPTTNKIHSKSKHNHLICQKRSEYMPKEEQRKNFRCEKNCMRQCCVLFFFWYDKLFCCCWRHLTYLFDRSHWLVHTFYQAKIIHILKLFLVYFFLLFLSFVLHCCGDEPIASMFFLVFISYIEWPF